MFSAAPRNVGENGSAAPGHGEPFGYASVFGPLVIWKVEELCTGASPDHGVNDASVVYVPQRVGVARGARSPPKKFTSASSNANCGLFSNVETICPTASQDMPAITSPAP